jgi:membrane associated rhomboid family serine protease
MRGASVSAAFPVAPSMLTCPHEHGLLRQTKVAKGVAFVCAACGGRAILMPLLRQQLEPEVARDVWAAAVRSVTPGLPCPSCLQPSARITIAADGSEVELDVCRFCTCVWFDAGERERLADQPPPRPPDADLPPEVRQHLAIEKVREMARLERERVAAAPDLSLAKLPALFGMPVELDEIDERAGVGRPWLTWATAAAMAAISMLGFAQPSVIVSLALVPDRLGDSLGLALLTCFFVHAGWMHLLGNLWFLVVFGDDVEQVFGRARWGALIIAATVLGSLAQVLGDPRGGVPCVGASGGISGLIVCYALILPERRLGIWLWIAWRPVWVAFSARTGLVCWFAMQAFLLWKQVAGISDVSALAHLGGVVAGVVVWLLWLDRAR